MTVMVILGDMPHRIKALARKNEDDSYTIVLNARHTREQNLKSYEHEMRHIAADHFSMEDQVGLMEMEARR